MSSSPTSANAASPRTATFALSLASASVSDRGTARERNGDSVLEDSRHRLFAVADGVGASPGAAVASRTAIHSVQEFLGSQAAHLSCNNAAPVMQHAFESANRAILQEGDTRGQRIQSTLTAVVFVDERMYVGHTGDSRAYLLADGQARAITRDHTVVGDLVRESLISEESARSHPRRGMLSSCLGWYDKFRFDSFCSKVRPGDAVILCSDGVSAFLSEDDVLECRESSDDASSIAGVLAAKALANGSSDDLSVVVILVEPGPAPGAISACIE